MISHNIIKKQEPAKQIAEKNRNPKTEGHKYDMAEHAWGTNPENKALGYLMQKENRTVQMKKIYGMDFPKISEQEIIAEIISAVNNGYVEFDSAFTYNIPDLSSLPPDVKSKIQVIYKYKYENKDDATADLAKKYNGIKIETIMLHEIPDRNLEEALKHLADLCIMHHANAGVSNVNELLLEYISQTLASRHVTLKRIENRVNLLKPDKNVRTYAANKGIEYMGYGLFGSVPSQGTCGSTQQELLNEEYILYNDPLLLELEQTSQKTIRQIILGWAEQNQISVITRSSKPENQKENIQKYVLTENEKTILKHFNDGDHIDYYYEHYFDKTALEVLDKVWGQNARKIYYMQVMCAKGYFEVQKKYTQILLDIHWFVDKGIKFDSGVSGIASKIQSLMDLKTLPDIDLSFCPAEKNISMKSIKSKRYTICDSNSMPVTNDFSDKEKYTLFDRVSQACFLAEYHNEELCIKNIIQQ